MLILPVMSGRRLARQRPAPYLRKMVLMGEDLDSEIPVGNIHHAFDGNEATYANGDTYAAGQGIKGVFAPTRIGKARLRAHVYPFEDDPGWGFCRMSFGGNSIEVGMAQNPQEAIWTGDMVVAGFDVTEWPRTRTYAIEMWEIVTSD